MSEVSLTFPDNDGIPQTVGVDGDRISFGRGSEADLRFADTGLSRLHATLYSEHGRVWIVDENSTNGTFVNGEPVASSGTPLKNDDKIRIGHETVITVRIGDPAKKPEHAAPPVSVSASSESAGGIPFLIPGLVITAALLVIGISAAAIGLKFYAGENKDDDPFVFETPPPRDATPTPGKTPKDSTDKPVAEPTKDETGNIPIGPTPESTSVSVPAGKYQDMSNDDKNRYIAVRAEKIARIIGNQKSDPIPPAAVAEIRRFLDAYVGRLRSPTRDSCEQGGWTKSDFNSVLRRATKTSPLVVRSFRAERIEPQIGIYVAMIEGEHCPCLTSNTGARGMFQFLASSAPDYGLAPDQRCDPALSAQAGAKYLKSLIARFGTAPDSVPLAIASFNSGQGNLSKNLDTAFSGAAGQNRSFWTLIEKKSALEGGAGKQFNSENIHYVPKFFAAAIIGENPSDFGVGIQPLSSYGQ